MADCKKYSRVPSGYQELTNIANSGTQYIDTGLKGSDLVDCELEIVMRNDTGITTSYNFNGTYLSGSTAQFGLVATSSSECRSSINFGFADAVSTTGLSLYEFHTIYVTNGLQKVDNTVVGTSNFGTLNDGNFLLFARTDPNQTSGVNICPAMGLKSFTVKRNNQFIRNMIPVRRKSDSQLGLYDLANNVFYTNQGTGSFMAGSDVNYWQHSLRKLTTATDTFATLPVDVYADGNNATVSISGNTVQNGTPTPDNPIMPQGTGERTKNLWDGVIGVDNVILDQNGTQTPNNAYALSEYIPVEPNTSYIYHFYHNIAEGNRSTYSVVEYDSNKNVIRPLTLQRITENRDYNISFTTQTNTAYIRINWKKTFDEDLMLNTGSTHLPYEPYGYKIPISSADTTTPVYLGEVETTRKIRCIDLSEYNFVYNSQSQIWICTTIPNVKYTSSSTELGNALAEKYINHTASGLYAAVNNFAISTNSVSVNTGSDSISPSGKLYYALATPTTGIVNEPLMKIGNYADTVSGITIPTITGKDAFDVQTTPKPSEASLSYTGWHDATVEEWDGSDWQ